MNISLIEAIPMENQQEKINRRPGTILFLYKLFSTLDRLFRTVSSADLSVSYSHFRKHLFVLNVKAEMYVSFFVSIWTFCSGSQSRVSKIMSRIMRVVVIHICRRMFVKLNVLFLGFGCFLKAFI